MKVLQLCATSLTCLSLSACLSGGGGGDNEVAGNPAPAFAATGVYQGLLQTTEGAALWATALVTEQGPLLGLVRDADDQLLGLFQATPAADGSAEGQWLPQGELAGALMLSTSGLQADGWQGEFSTQALQGEWQLAPHTPAQALEVGDRYGLLFAGQASNLELAADQRFVLENADCRLEGDWQQQNTDDAAIVTLEPQQQQGCVALGEMQQMLAYQQNDALPEQPLLQLLWRSEQQAGAAYLFAAGQTR